MTDEDARVEAMRLLDAADKIMQQATFCETCDNVHSATRGLEPWKWRCMKAPIQPGFGFVAPNWAPHPPYAKCEYKNKEGSCEHFTPRRMPTKEAAE